MSRWPFSHLALQAGSRLLAAVQLEVEATTSHTKAMSTAARTPTHLPGSPSSPFPRRPGWTRGACSVHGGHVVYGSVISAGSKLACPVAVIHVLSRPQGAGSPHARSV